MQTGWLNQRADRRRLPLPDTAQIILRKRIREADEHSAGIVARRLRLPISAVLSGAAGARMSWEARRAVLRALVEDSAVSHAPLRLV
jgi:hypothetical protein